MKTLYYKLNPHLFFASLLILLLLSSCKKDKPFPVGTLDVVLNCTDSAGNIKSVFNYGDDIYFSAHEVNPLQKEVSYFRGSNLPQANFIIYDENGYYAGRTIDENTMTHYVLIILTLEPRRFNTITSHWFNLPTNSALPKGKYTVKYSDRITLVPTNTDIFDNSKEIIEKEAEQTFWVK